MLWRRGYHTCTPRQERQKERHGDAGGRGAGQQQPVTGGHEAVSGPPPTRHDRSEATARTSTPGGRRREYQWKDECKGPTGTAATNGTFCERKSRQRHGRETTPPMVRRRGRPVFAKAPKAGQQLAVPHLRYVEAQQGEDASPTCKGSEKSLTSGSRLLILMLKGQHLGVQTA